MKRIAIRHSRAAKALASLTVAAGLTVTSLVGAPAAEAVDQFVVCPSGVSAVSTADTSCPFADNVRYAFYHQVSWTVFALSPVTGLVYTMQCDEAWVTVGWSSPKRCWGVNSFGAPLVVYIA